MDLRINIENAGICAEEISAIRSDMSDAIEYLRSGKRDFTGWSTLPYDYDREELVDILKTAEEIKRKCSLLVVIGIGGSYLGALAAISALQERAMKDTECDSTGCPVCDGLDNGKGGCRVLFAGCNLSGTYHKKILREMENEDVCLLVISKSGSTTEIKVAFSIFKEALIKKYGEDEAASRIYAVTDKVKGELRAEADREGYKSFIVPDEIGGRYSVLTPVGLLPIACAGIDVKALLEGAKVAADDFVNESSVTDYAAVRFLHERKGTVIEILEYYEPQMEYFTAWCKQLFGESEGKGGMGLFPASLAFTTDLHSMEQFLQDGKRTFFETVINVVDADEDIEIPASAGEVLAGRTMNDVNKIAVAGVTAAHKNAGIPMVRIDIPELTPYYFGQLIYFFEMTCGITGTLMGVDPFNQPGVENYKAEMRKELNK